MVGRTTPTIRRRGVRPPSLASGHVIPVRDDLRVLEGYHSPQVDVRVRLNTNESPVPPLDAFRDALAAEIALDVRAQPLGPGDIVQQPGQQLIRRNVIRCRAPTDQAPKKTTGGRLCLAGGEHRLQQASQFIELTAAGRGRIGGHGRPGTQRGLGLAFVEFGVFA